jgi:hypothetical protein
MAEKSELKEDFLEVDQTIPGQNYTCLSFISPEKNISEKKDFISFKYVEHLFNNELECKSLKEDCKLSNYSTKLEDFRVGNQVILDKEYNEMTDFQTSVRGVKVRGTYETEREAKVRAEVLRRRFPNDNVFVGQVGYWLPWDPNPLDVKNLEYQENELNTLMKKYNENMEHREFMFDEERRTKLDKAKKENEEQKTVNEGEKAVDEESVEYDDEHRKKFSEFRNILNEKDALMTGADPWIQRKEETIEDSNDNEDSDSDIFEDVGDGKPEEECILKDSDVEQNIEINYNSSSNELPVEELETPSTPVKTPV